MSIMEGDQLADRERQIMRHALGLDRSEKSYRNHYCCIGDPIVSNLCERGLMKATRPGVYAVTRSGLLLIEKS